MANLTSVLPKINLYTWFQDRKLDFCPNHFVCTSTALTPDSKIWIEEQINGRYCFITKSNNHSMNSISVDELQTFPAFEDPKEAILYELTWSD